MSSFSWGAGEQRLSLIHMGVEGHKPLADVKSFLDIGVIRRGEKCEILFPRAGTKAATRPWAPFDFYTNITSDEQRQKAQDAGQVGEPDVFWMGDDHNRNAANHKHDQTREVTASFQKSLEFKEPRNGTDSFSRVLAFTRGPIVFSSLILVKTWARGAACAAAAFQCTKPFQREGVTECQEDGWTRKIQGVVATASASGASWDYFRGITDERLKNDVSAVEGIFQRYHADFEGHGEPFRETVAP